MTREHLVKLLLSIWLSDQTVYQHHQPRARDGKLPVEDGGTRWRTPAERSYYALKEMGIDPWDLREQW